MPAAAERRARPTRVSGGEIMMAALYRHTEDLARSRPGHSVVTTRAANGTAEIRPGCVSWILAVASGRRRDGSQGGGGANSGAMGDDDNAARRPPATVRQTPVQQAEDLRDTPFDLAALATHWRPSQGPYCARA